MKRSALIRWIPFRLAALVAPLIAAWPQRAQAADGTWTATTSAVWHTITNWSPNTAFPGANGATANTDTAIFSGTVATAIVGLNQNTAGATFSLGGIDFNRSVATAMTLGNNSATNGVLRLNGSATIGSNTLIRVQGSADLTLSAAGVSGGTGTMGVQLGITNGQFNVASGRSLVIQSIISQLNTNSGFTKTGAGTVSLSAANTYNGTVVVNDGVLRISNATALGTGTSAITVVNGDNSASNNNDLQITGGISVNRNLILENTAGANARTRLVSTNTINSNNNTWSGSITFKGFSNQSLVADTAPLTLSGALQQDGTTPSTSIFFRGTNTGTLSSTATVNLGAATFLKTEGGTWIVNNTANTWGLTAIADGQVQVGATNALPTGVTVEIGQNGAGTGRLELNGFNQTVPTLRTHVTSSSTAHVIRNSNLATASTLTFANATGTTVLKSANVFGSASGLGTLHMVSNGAGRTEFQDGLLDANTWTVNAGTVAFTGNASRQLPGTVTGVAAATVEKAGTGSLLARGAWNNAGTTNVTGGMLILSSGTAGGINVSDGAALAAGQNGGVVNATGLTFGTAGATGFSPILGAAMSPAPLAPATLTANGTTVVVTPQAGTFTPNSTYPLIDYGTLGGSGAFVLGAVGTYPHMTATVDNNLLAGRIDLNVTDVDSLIWTGNTNNTWDVNTTSNFALASSSSTPATFYQSDAVVFGDTSDVPAPATAVTNRTLTGGPVNIGNLTFTNTTGIDYSVANILTGAGGVSKTGTGNVTLSGTNSYLGTTSVSAGQLTLSAASTLPGAVNVSGGTLVLGGANNLGGAVNVTGGTLKIGNADALRGAASITVSGGGTFDANGTAVGTRFTELIVSGTGVGGNGAIVNNGAAVTNNSHFQKYTLAGDTTWGGSGRYDIVAGQIFSGTTFTLTKVGAGELWYNPSAGSTLENVIVNGGSFGSQGANPLSTTATVTVNNGGTHQIYSNVAQQHKVVLNDGGILRSTNSTPTLNGSVTLNGTTTGRNIQATSGTTLNVAGKITGTGGFTVNDTGTVQLQNATNDYAGNTALNAGTLHFNATGILPATTNLIFGGGTLDPANRTHSVASISGLSGSINQGTAGTGKVISTQSTTTTFNGTVNRVNLTMNGSGSLTLGGTADNVAGNVTVEQGTVILAKGNTAAALQAVHAVATGGLTINGGTVQLAGTYDNVNTLGTGVNLAPVGFNATTYGDLIYNAVGVALNAGTLDLNGRQEAINTLANPAGTGGTVTNTSATAARLYIGHQNGTSTFGGAISNGTGTVAIEKIGTGSLTLSGTNTYTGDTTVTGGTLVIPVTSSLGNTAVAINTGGTFAPSGNVGATGSITLNTGGTLNVGGNNGGNTATTISAGSLTLGGGTVNMDFTGTAADRINTSVSNGLTINATTVNTLLGSSGWVTGTYPAYTYAGTVQGAGAAALTQTTLIGHNTVSFLDDLAGTVNLVVAAADNKWVGGAGNAWDHNSTLNWNAGDQKFLNGDNAVFDNTATTFTPSLAASVTPAVTIFNSGTYTLSGAAGIAGPGQLVKNSGDTVTLLNPNTYTGNTMVNAGTLVANYNAGAAVTVLAAASTVNVAANATFRAVANDANLTLANNLTGTGTVVVDPHLTAGGAVREVVISGNNAGFTGTLRLSPTTGVATGLGTFRTNAALTPANAGGATIDVDAGGQAWISAATFTNNFILTGHGFGETAGGTPLAASGLTPYSGTVKGGIGAIRMSDGGVISGNITLDGSAKVMAYGGTGTLSGSIGVTNTADLLVVGGGGAGSNLLLTGTNNTGGSPLNGIFVNSGSTTGTQLLSIGNNTTTGTLGTGPITLNGDAGIAALRFDRSDGYTLAAGNTITSSGTTPANTQLRIDTQGTGFMQNGVAINLGGGALQIGTVRANTVGTLNGAVTAGALQVGQAAAGTGATLTLASGANVSVGSIAVGQLATGAVVNIQPGATVATAGSFWLGEGNGFSGTVNQTGGGVTVGSHIRIGHWPNNTSAWNLSGSTSTVAVTANPGLATDPSTAGATEQNGGLYLGIDGTGIVNHSNGTVTTDWVVLDNRGDTAGSDQYNLSGGTLELRGQYGIALRNASSAFNFTGGTIKNVGTGVNARILSGGTFAIGTGGTGTPTIDTNGATNAFTSTAVLTGAGTLAKAGAGTLNFNAASPAWTGNLQVDGGTVATSTISGGLGSFTTAGRTITVNNGGTVSVGINNVFGNGVANPDLPALVVNAGGTFSSTNYNALGNVTLNGGTLTQASTAGPGAYEGYQLRGDVTVGGTAASSITTTNGKGTHLSTNTLFTVADATGSSAVDLTVSTPFLNPSGDFGGTGGFTKDGPGTMTIAAGVVSTYTGPTTINTGILRLEPGSSIASSSLTTINNGGTLGGTGTTGALTVSAGGTINPGASPGILSTGGITTAGNVNIEIGGLTAGNGSGFHDQINTAGSFTLNGGLLVVSLVNSYVPNQNDFFDIWLNDGADAIAGSGNFTGMPEGFGDSGTWPVPETAAAEDYWSITYLGNTGNDIRLTYVPEPGTATLAGLAAIALLTRRRRTV